MGRQETGQEKGISERALAVIHSVVPIHLLRLCKLRALVRARAVAK